MNFKQRIKYKLLRCDLSREIDFVAEKGGEDWITNKWSKESKSMTFLIGERCDNSKWDERYANCNKVRGWVPDQRAKTRKSLWGLQKYVLENNKLLDSSLGGQAKYGIYIFVPQRIKHMFG